MCSQLANKSNYLLLLWSILVAGLRRNVAADENRHPEQEVSTQ